MSIGVGVLATGSYLPEAVLGNDELAPLVGVEPAWIEAKTGILTRHVAAPGEATSDLAAQAAWSALEAAQLPVSAIDALIVATATPDHAQPATASFVHGLLGLRADVGAMDINVVCSGFVQALHTGAALLAAERRWQHVLVVGAETATRAMRPGDRRTRVLFGDGAGAVVLGRAETIVTREPVRAHSPGNGGSHAPAILAASFGTEPKLGPALVVPAGGSREPLTSRSGAAPAEDAGTVDGRPGTSADAAIDAGRAFFQMDGPVVREYAERIVPHAVRDVCAKAGIEVDRLDLVVPHQSNLRIMEPVAAELGLPAERMVVCVDRTGNTGSASVGIALHEAARHGLLQRGDLVCLVGYGGGLAHAALVLRW